MLLESKGTSKEQESKQNIQRGEKGAGNLAPPSFGFEPLLILTLDRLDIGRWVCA